MPRSNSQTELETKIAFLERTVDDLNEVVVEQGRTIERLELRLAGLATRFASEEGGDDDAASAADETPPHY